MTKSPDSSKEFMVYKEALRTSSQSQIPAQSTVTENGQSQKANGKPGHSDYLQEFSILTIQAWVSQASTSALPLISQDSTSKAKWTASISSSEEITPS